MGKTGTELHITPFVCVNWKKKHISQCSVFSLFLVDPVFPVATELNVGVTVCMANNLTMKHSYDYL